MMQTKDNVLSDEQLQQRLQALLIDLQQTIQRFQACLAEDSLLHASGMHAAWLELSDPCLVGNSHELLHGGQAVQWASQLFGQFEYRVPFQASRQTAMAVGYLMVEAQTQAAAVQVNVAKEDFERVVVGLSEQAGMKNVYRRNQKVQALLADMGVGRLCLQQVYRHLPIVESDVKRIAFGWVTKPAVVKITPLEACQLLDKLMQQYPDSRGLLESQHKRLAGLAEDTPLVRELQISTGMKARLSAREKRKTSKGNPYYPRITASMPLLLTAQSQPPELVLPKPKGESEGGNGGPASQRGECLAPSINVWSKSF